MNTCTVSPPTTAHALITGAEAAPQPERAFQLHAVQARAEAQAFPTLEARQALWLKGAILVAFLAASSVPPPLRAMYGKMWGFSELTLTSVFASHALALIAALLVLGTLSAFRGRRAMLVTALGLEIVAVMLFLRADSVAWLVAARLLQDAATGIACGTLGAELVDLHPQRSALISGVAPMVGLGLGALGASALLPFAPAPTRLVFEILLIIFMLQLTAALYLPETLRRSAGALPSLVPRTAARCSHRRGFHGTRPVLRSSGPRWQLQSSMRTSMPRSLTQGDRRD
ncbi:hypothetical protein QTI66_35810 [Variovorax sp. J22R133]|uniref:hypothetical protein n=1 Tax=Variovorax brevis TaxID=3053503 RepID=UPI0025777CC7|nr:hypothetical protein [Variovorax sp. J22R133]MDM0117485.1 hypothetical protein [Variovorax sp. J22R133]